MKYRDCDRNVFEVMKDSLIVKKKQRQASFPGNATNLDRYCKGGLKYLHRDGA